LRRQVRGWRKERSEDRPCGSHRRSAELFTTEKL
jgi:hypothetical protein